MSSSEEALVSILINNYNYARFLGDAIESALGQSYTNVEVIVVDDGSTDNSRDVLASFGKRIHSIFQPNGGQASSFNTGFAASRGEFICFLDADDVFKPEKAQFLVDTFASDPTLGWYFDRVFEFDHETGYRWPPADAASYGKWDARRATMDGKPPLVPTATSGLSFRRQTLKHILPMPELLRVTADAYLKWTALSLAPGWFASEELTLMRIHGNNLFTKRHQGKRRLTGQAEFLAGVSIYQGHPSLRRLAAKVLTRGLGKIRVHGSMEPGITQPLRSLVQTLPLSERMEIFLRAFYWTAFEQLRRG
jgi:glycosyltransferase involved in cell wall biosynthesis